MDRVSLEKKVNSDSKMVRISFCLKKNLYILQILLIRMFISVLFTIIKILGVGGRRGKG